VLEAIPGRRLPSLVVLPVRGVYWSDWGSEQRIASTLARPIERAFDARGASNATVRAEAV
jgi:hypothetical protein